MKTKSAPTVAYTPTAVVFDTHPKGEAQQLAQLRDRFAALTTGIKEFADLSTISAGRPKAHQYDGARSFIQFPLLLTKEGLFISGCYINISGKLVFTIGNTLDVIAERLFLTIADHTGWSVTEFRNADGTKVWAANNAHPLSDEVKVKGRNGSPDTFSKRTWKSIQVWPTRV